MVRIGPVKQRIEYEGINMICFHCGKIIHKKEKCLLIVQEPTQVTNSLNVAVTSNAGNVEDSYGPWMIVENKKSKSKGSLTNGQGIRTNGGKEETANRFSSLPEQQSVDVDGNGEKKEEAFNAKFSNRNADNDVVRDGNSKIFGRKLHSREMNANSGSPTNGVLLQTTQGKNMNRKCNFPTNAVSIGDINDGQSVAKDSRNKGKVL